MMEMLGLLQPIQILETTPLASTTAYDEAIPNLNRIASDTAVLKTRGRTLSIATSIIRTCIIQVK